MAGQPQPVVRGATGGAALVLGDGTRWAWVTDPYAEFALASSAAALDPGDIPKYVTDLDSLPAMPRDGTILDDCADNYVIGVRQFRQRILPPPLPETTVWGYGSLARPDTFRFPAGTIEASVDRPVRVTWVNELVDRSGRFLPPLLPVDPPLAWANPAGGPAGRDGRATRTPMRGPYTGPTPIVTHLDDGRATEESEGHPEAWYLPAAADVPAGYATVGSRYERHRTRFADLHAVEWQPGTATFQYANDQRATTLWYRDHVLGMSRESVYAGLAGFYLVRGGLSDLPPGVLPGPAPALGDPPGRRYHEIPIVIQDRSFTTAGSLRADGLFLPASRADGTTGPYVPDSGAPQLWVPGFIGTTMVVNGRTWPVLRVGPRRYRLRLLNGGNGRFLILKIATDPVTRPASAAVPFWQIGDEGGFLPRPVPLSRLLLADGERADVIVDFTGMPEGVALYLVNEGPDGPFTGGEPGVDYPPADPATTGQVMKFLVSSMIGTDTSVPPEQLTLPRPTPPGPTTVGRRVRDRRARPGAGPDADMFGMVDTTGDRVLLRPAGPAPHPGPAHASRSLGGSELWEVHNLTAEPQPVHLEDVQFQVVGRGLVGVPARPPERWEAGFKQVLVVHPGEVVRVRTRTLTERSPESGPAVYLPHQPVDGGVADGSGDPVFVDDTGGRRRMFIRLCAVGGGMLALTAAAMLAGFTGGGSGHLPGLPGSGVGREQPVEVTPGPPRSGPTAGPTAPAGRPDLDERDGEVADDVDHWFADDDTGVDTRGDGDDDAPDGGRTDADWQW